MKRRIKKLFQFLDKYTGLIFRKTPRHTLKMAAKREISKDID